MAVRAAVTDDLTSSRQRFLRRAIVAGGTRSGAGASDLDCEAGDLGRIRADADAVRLEGLLLRLSGAGGAGDDRPGVAHGLAGRGGETGDVGDDRLRHLGFDEGGGLLLLCA